MTHESHLIARADDRAMITAVLHRYAHLARDEADFTLLGTLFTPTGTFSLQDGTTWGRDEIHNVVRGDEAAYIRHHATTIDIEFVDENTAHTITTFFTITDEASPDHWGNWEDVLRKQSNGTWLIDTRVVTAEGADPEGWLMRVYTAEAEKS
ncbi:MULTISPECIES: nuclear transport factor 2 family protein [unclassified Rhodococcus (in: high G+C Gram-positive bacteria)]|uniref:nuclear transport factor 2 family protein n=1 Tax=unclassified Rhodococcus (in: high G+C Gram-positive bacteria) TaxID=192944 RepID=UPI000A83EDF7|nr:MULTISPECIES: nuclear transport factor 2 family protein [unclassified Rhodococcus (in: high G+C Gram-positive bacteria)]